MSERFQNGATVPLTVTALDHTRTGAAGLADVLLSIRRESDDYYLDFDDMTFKVSGWTTRQQVMAEKDSTYSPGVYFYDFDATGFDDDSFHLEASSASAENSPWADWAYVGDYLSTTDITTAILNMVYEGAETFKTHLRVARSVLAGNRSGFIVGSERTGKFASIDGSKTRVTSPHDANGNTTGNITVDGGD